MDKPEWYSNLKKWRIDNGLNTEPWNLYAHARTDQANILMACCFVIGLFTGYFLR